MTINFKLDKLSVIGRAAEAYATGELSEVKERAERLYLGKRYPFVISRTILIPFTCSAPVFPRCLRVLPSIRMLRKHGN